MLATRPPAAAPAPIELTEFQALVVSAPHDVSLFLGGGKGGGKTYALALLAADHATTYGTAARILIFRESFPAMKDLELLLLDLLPRLFPGARYNASDHLWQTPSGALVELGYLADHADLRRYAGRGRTLILGDEVGLMLTLDLVDLLATNLRGPRGVPTRLVLAANPGGPMQSALAERYVHRAPQWTEFTVGQPGAERAWMYCPSTYRDNPHLDASYAAQLRSIREIDPELAKALEDGDWNSLTGAYFGSVLSRARSGIEPPSAEFMAEQNRRALLGAPLPGPRLRHVGALGHLRAHREPRSHGAGWPVLSAR
jgi:hypothetical protein